MKETKPEELCTEVYLNLQKIFRCINIGQVFQGKRLPITITQMRVLSLFNERDVVNISDISRSLGMSLQSATNLVRRLEELGYLERSKNRQDKRVSEVKLTGKGASSLIFFREGELKTIERILHRLDPFEEKVLNEALTNASILFEKAILASLNSADDMDAKNSTLESRQNNETG